MKRITATLMLLVALASPLWAQTYDQNTGSNTTNTQTDQATTATDNTTTTENLPATASPLPLLLLAGVGAMASSLWLRRRHA